MKSRILLILPAAALLLSACGARQQQNAAVMAERVEQVQTTTVSRSTVTRSLEVSSTLQGWQTMNIAPSLTGKIEHIYTEVGTRVHKGDMLVRMDRNQYNTAKLTYTNLKVEMDRVEALHQSGAVSQQTYDQTKLSFDQASESYKFLEQNTFVKAQFDGVISAKNYEDGELYSGAPILVLTQINVLKALIAVPESYFPHVKQGMKVEIESDIYPGEKFPATIEVIYPTIDAASHTFQVKVRIPNSSLKLRPGMYVHTRVEMGQVNAITVPYEAVQKMTGSNDRFVFINDGGVARRVFVTVGARYDADVEILGDALKEGDRLVTVGQAKLVDGTALNVVKEN
ncbi:MAG: efflux RND transporter periplasmic adaptor subunit [Bacteroidales bacterium]|nr:efflux RND transporter periplasmic adaptor subunit [Bacteroidales bacterium]